MYPIIQAAHSGWRWIVLITLVWATGLAVSQWFGKKPLSEGARKATLFALIATHVQFLMGLVLYFVSPKVQLGNMGEAMKTPLLRFYTVEHFTLMILAVVLVTIGYNRAKKYVGTTKGSTFTAIFLLLALALIMAGIPWPPKYGAGW
ncbi:MAG TPA: hypothetical protein VJ917_05625, partial [Saprospiraceae bacterium]|nr:hypothetical protein [Saprospiraceae bacterium]